MKNSAVCLKRSAACLCYNTAHVACLCYNAAHVVPISYGTKMIKSLTNFIYQKIFPM